MYEAFKDHRREIFREADAIVRPLVERAMNAGGRGSSWDSVLDAATNVWLSIIEAEAPEAFPDQIVKDFRSDLRKHLDQTKINDAGPTDGEIERVTQWIGTYTVNSATWYAGRAQGDRTKTWITMHDGLVRPIHHVVDGQTQPIGGTFVVGGQKLRFPGEPVGPAEVWINCRCIIAPGGARAVTASIEPEVEEVIDPDDMEEVDIEGEELVDDPIDEIPVHGVAAPMGVPTGDGRMFADGSLTWRDLPLPIRVEIVGAHGGDTSEVVTVGRIDDMWVDEKTNMVRYRGALVMSKEYAPYVVEGIVDQTIRGVSVEVDDVALDVEEDRERVKAMLKGEQDPAEQAKNLSDEEIEALVDQYVGDGKMPMTVFKAARIAGFTIVPIPAYQEAFISLGEAFEDELSDEDKEALAACGCGKGVAQEEDFREVSTKERKKLADEGNALPDGSFPIDNVEDLKNAIQAIGRAKDPAKAKAHIKKRARALGHPELIPEDWSGAVDTFAPGTKDGPGWITHPTATARIRRYWVRGKGAAKIRWGVPGDFNRCRRQLVKYVQNPDWLAGLCANMHKEALGFWPGEHHSADTTALAASAHGESGWTFSIVASGGRTLPAEYFKRPDTLRPDQGVVVDGDRVYGYVAEWGVCHIGIPGTCTTAPHSATNYHYFATGYVTTDEGDIRVGQITMDTGHAKLKASARAAASHYDNTGAAVADIAIGEDSTGIWFAGMFRPSATEEQRHALKASGRLSGDWRALGSGKLELVAALAVNVPGFPIPKLGLAASAGEQLSLVAAGIVAPSAEPEPIVAGAALDADTVVAISRAAVAEYINENERREKLEATAAKRQEIRARKLAALRAKVSKER